MISHGFVSAAMFLCVGVLYDRMHSHEIASYGGRVNTMPTYTALVVSSRWPTAACRAPPASSASGWSSCSVKANFWLGALAATALRASAPPTSLWMIAAVFLARSPTRTCRRLTDASAASFLTLAVLAVPVLGWACIPNPFTDVMQVSVSELLRHRAVRCPDMMNPNPALRHRPA